MKYLLALIGILSLFSCAGPYNPLSLQSIFMCENHSLIIMAGGNYPKGRVAEVEIYKDENLNKQLDEHDHMEKQTFMVMLRSEDPQLLGPIKVDSSLTDRYMFVVLKAGEDSVVSTIVTCKTDTDSITN